VSRFFNAPTTADSITFAVTRAPLDEGPITMAALVRASSTGFTGWAVQGQSAGNAGVWAVLCSGGKFFVENDFTTGGQPVTTDWLWVVATKAAGSVLPRWHIKNLTTGSAWVHADGPGNVSDVASTATHILVGGNGSSSTSWRGRIAAAAAWRGVLTDLQIEAACTLLAKDLRLAEPAWAVLLNQASTATAVLDITGNGGNQTAISGTAVDADDPPGFDYTVPTVEHLFTTQTPTGANFLEGAPTTLATTVGFTTAGTVTGGRFYAPSSPSGTYQLVLWQVTHEDDGAGAGTVLATANFTAEIEPSAWNAVQFATPVAVDTTHAYKIGIRSSVGSYAASGSFFASAELDNGHIYGLRAQTLYPALSGSFYNGSFVGDVTSFPNQQFNQTSYFVDVSFVAGAAPAGVTPGGLAVPVALGPPAVAIGLSAAPAGLAIPVALGQPSVGPAGVSPSGLAIPLALGQPVATVANSAAPAGLAIPVAIGHPSTLPPVATDSPNLPIVASSRRDIIVASSRGRAVTR
jgi:hypothetical protein